MFSGVFRAYRRCGKRRISHSYRHLQHSEAENRLISADNEFAQIRKRTSEYRWIEEQKNKIRHGISGGQEINKAIAGKRKPLSAEIVPYGAEQNSYHYEAIYQRTLGGSERISPAWNSQSDRLSEVLSVFYRMTN